MSVPRYRAGCAGMFELVMGCVTDFDDELDALSYTSTVKACEVLDTRIGRWSAPESWEDVVEIQGLWSARDVARREITEALR